jgi:hypothetical protein
MNRGALIRCHWATNELAIAYHDCEWGVPQHDDRKLFELLILEGAQAVAELEHDSAIARELPEGIRRIRRRQDRTLQAAQD